MKNSNYQIKMEKDFDKSKRKKDNPDKPDIGEEEE